MRKTEEITLESILIESKKEEEANQTSFVNPE